MKTPKRLLPLLEDGLIDEVLGSLMSGKEATVYLVRCGGAVRCAKVYKEAATRSFKQAVQYQEGRKVRNSRRQRAMDKSSRYGRAQQEEVWHTAEVDALNRLAQADVRVPESFGCFDGVLLMELIVGSDGEPAPRLNDVALSPEVAQRDHDVMMNYILRMLCAGLVHGDLSEFNVLMTAEGPVIIDLPQAVDAAGNNHAFDMLVRDVGNISRYYARFVPELEDTRYAEEIWAMFEDGTLHPDAKLTGHFERDESEADVGAVLSQIAEAEKEEAERQERLRDS